MTLSINYQLFIIHLVADCGEPCPPPVGTFLDPSSDTATTVGSQRNYTCDGDKKIPPSVSLTIECLVNGRWSGNPPTCGNEYIFNPLALVLFADF